MDWEKIRDKIRQIARQDVCLAFSGGVDSSILLRLLCDASRETGNRVYAVTFQTRLHSPADLETARKVAEETGAIHCVLEVDESENEEILYNPVNRCYLCKKYLFSKLIQFGKAHGITIFLDGTNADDLNAYRPGIQALRELGFRSPLAELGITKAKVREMARELGLSVAFRPSAPCLATRLPYGARLDFQLFERIDKGENFLKELGFPVVRLRVHQDIARIEVPKEQIPELTARREEVARQLKELGFDYITVDLEGFRSGSMDIHIRRETGSALADGEKSDAGVLQ